MEIANIGAGSNQLDDLRLETSSGPILLGTVLKP